MSSDSATSFPPGLTAKQKALFRTELCRFFASHGYCLRGEKCTFAHGAAQLRPKPASHISHHPLFRSVNCYHLHALGTCRYGDRCSYKHEPVASLGESQAALRKLLASCYEKEAGSAELRRWVADTQQFVRRRSSWEPTVDARDPRAKDEVLLALSKMHHDFVQRTFGDVSASTDPSTTPRPEASAGTTTPPRRSRGRRRRGRRGGSRSPSAGKSRSRSRSTSPTSPAAKPVAPSPPPPAVASPVFTPQLPPPAGSLRAAPIAAAAMTPQAPAFYPAAYVPMAVPTPVMRPAGLPSMPLVPPMATVPTVSPAAAAPTAAGSAAAARQPMLSWEALRYSLPASPSPPRQPIFGGFLFSSDAAGLVAPVDASPPPPAAARMSPPPASRAVSPPTAATMPVAEADDRWFPEGGWKGITVC
eukprot:PLAT13627.1.p1 GENE.PLAT13627.1~~PLAT13627.1.p1  ORF type:complete len:436 (-),score=135.58 PLAT13627.1:272-1522(-)